MKYVLSEQEYKSLLDVKKKQSDADIKELQDFCTMVANTLPVAISWRKNDKDYVPEPWGCILTEGNEDWECDECPSQKVCPNKHKSWSQ